MKRQLLTLILITAGIFSFSLQETLAQACSDAGTAAASADSVCYADTTTLTITGYVGNTIQWQSSLDNITFVDETGTGATTDTYDVNPQETTFYRAIVTDTGCLSDTGNVVTLTVGVIPVPSASNVTRCGPGMVSLSGVGNGDLQWYTDPTGGYPFATGNPTMEYFPASTTIYVEDNTQGGSGGASPLLITEFDLGNNDYLELQNVSNQPVDVTGWQVAINGSYTDINNVNGNVQILSGIMNPGDIITFTDNTGGPNYWGSNMLWNPGAGPTFTGWALILDNQNDLRDFVPLNWPDATIQTMNVNINGTMVMPGTIWNGNGVDQSTVTAGSTGVSRTGGLDNDDSSDFAIESLTIGVTNNNATLPFLGFGCSSPRVPVQVTITPSDSVSISATLPALCQGQSTTLTASSSNANYNYTWTPATGLNTTTGPVVTANPTVTTTYVVTGDDGTCANVDTIEIAVGTPSIAGTAVTFQDTICLGNDAYLLLQNSNGSIQWQSFDGTSWVNESGPGSDSTTYVVSPTTSTTYWAVVTSGGCPSDTSAILDITVLSITEPVVSDTSLCGSGSVSLTATGQGNFNWYDDSTSVNPIFTGATYSFNATTTDTLWVEAFGGSTNDIGPVSPGIGSQTNGTSNDLGCAFDVTTPCTIETVKVFPQTAGPVTVNLRQTQGGPILASYSTNVIAFLGQDLPINFAVSPGTGYRLELAAGSVACTRNTNGAMYPYQVANGPLEITGYYNPNFGTGAAYYWFYDWKVTEGCKSGRVPSIVTVNAFPSIPTISQLGNNLISSAATGNQWLLNGTIIPGAIGQSYTPTQIGTYTVAVTENGCTSISPPFPVTSVGLNEIDGIGFTSFPNPVSGTLNLRSDKPISFDGVIKVYDMQGREVMPAMVISDGTMISREIDVTRLEEGMYFLNIQGNDSSARISFQVVR